MTQRQNRPLRMAVGAVNSWLGAPELTALLAYIDGIVDEGGTDDLARLAVGLTVLAGRLARRMDEVSGVSPGDLLADIVQLAEQSAL